MIHGTAFGSSRIGGISFSDVPYRVHLADLGFRLRERLLYAYDFRDGWPHDLHVEVLWGVEPRRHYPLCIAGWRAAPPEDCVGPWAFHEVRQRHAVVATTVNHAHVWPGGHQARQRTSGVPSDLAGLARRSCGHGGRLPDSAVAGEHLERVSRHDDEAEGESRP